LCPAVAQATAGAIAEIPTQVSQLLRCVGIVYITQRFGQRTHNGNQTRGKAVARHRIEDTGAIKHYLSVVGKHDFAPLQAGKLSFQLYAKSQYFTIERKI
jgi:hypothetical protein